jgi:hypothetical protein
VIRILMSRKYTLLSCFGVAVLATPLVTLAMLPARAALRPEIYDELRIGAQEVLVIEVVSVKQKSVSNDQIEISVEAKILNVERSKAGLRKGEQITISYKIRNPKLPSIPGAGDPQILEQGSVYPAFLNRAAGSKIYEPTAHKSSFMMTPAQ